MSREEGKFLLSLFDWIAPFVEQATPKGPPKVPKAKIASLAAIIAYRRDPSDVPDYFITTLGGLPHDLGKAEKQKVYIHRIEEWILKHFAAIVRFMREVYDVALVHQDGDATSKGYRILNPKEKEAAEAQGEWDSAVVDGVQDNADNSAEHLPRLVKRAVIQRRVLATKRIPHHHSAAARKR